jgi:hypothetical protein
MGSILLPATLLMWWVLLSMALCQCTPQAAAQVATGGTSCCLTGTTTQKTPHQPHQEHSRVTPGSSVIPRL